MISMITLFHISISSATLIIIIKQKAIYRFHVATMLFYISQIFLTKVAYYANASITLRPQVYTAVMLVLLIVGNWELQRWGGLL